MKFIRIGTSLRIHWQALGTSAGSVPMAPEARSALAAASSRKPGEAPPKLGCHREDGGRPSHPDAPQAIAEKGLGQL
jgi:hypothetical protein